MILADTSVWIDHIRASSPEMVQLLSAGQILMHPFVVAEIALGSLKNRRKKLADLDMLLNVKVARQSEVRRMIEAHTLYAKGIRLTDAHLVASCLLTPGTRLWTRDAKLEKVAKALGILFKLP